MSPPFTTRHFGLRPMAFPMRAAARDCDDYVSFQSIRSLPLHLHRAGLPVGAACHDAFRHAG